MAPNTTTPPIVPPTIAPTFVDEDLGGGEGVGGEVEPVGGVMVVVVLDGGVASVGTKILEDVSSNSLWNRYS